MARLSQLFDSQTPQVRAAGPGRAIPACRIVPSGTTYSATSGFRSSGAVWRPSPPNPIPSCHVPMNPRGTDATGHTIGLVSCHFQPGFSRKGTGLVRQKRCRELQNVVCSAEIPAPGDPEIAPVLAVVALGRAALSRCAGDD